MPYSSEKSLVMGTSDNWKSHRRGHVRFWGVFTVFLTSEADPMTVLIEISREEVVSSDTLGLSNGISGQPLTLLHDLGKVSLSFSTSVSSSVKL